MVYSKQSKQQRFCNLILDHFLSRTRTVTLVKQNENIINIMIISESNRIKGNIDGEACERNETNKIFYSWISGFIKILV